MADDAQASSGSRFRDVSARPRLVFGVEDQFPLLLLRHVLFQDLLRGLSHRLPPQRTDYLQPAVKFFGDVDHETFHGI